MKRNKKGQFVKGEHWRQPKPHWDYDWLYHKYIIEQKSVMDIAKIVGCKRSNIQYWLTKHKIPTRSISEVRKLKYWGAVGSTNGMYGKTKENNPNWNGGCTPDRQAIYSSIEWSNLVKQVWKRDKATCQRCKTKKIGNNQYHIHHIESFSNKEKRLDINNLILLCKKCHEWVHSNKNKNKEFIDE